MLTMESLAHHRIDGVSFAIYPAHEIKKLSVLEITNVQCFDALGHASTGGLCDTALGPNARADACRTCQQGINDCNGHYGHISLPLPVFNPVFIRQLYQLLKMTCFKCHHLLVSPVGIQVFLSQLHAVDLGLDYLVDEIEIMADELVNTGSHQLSKLDFAGWLGDKLKSFLDAALEDKDAENHIAQVRSAVEKRQQLIKDFISGKLLKASKQCHNCAAQKVSVTKVSNSLLMINVSKRKSKASYDKDDEEDESLLGAVKVVANNYLTPLQARKVLRELWKNEHVSLKKIIGLLDIPADQSSHEAPTDVFFLDAIPVPPNKFRPLRFMAGRKFDNEHTTALNQVMLSAQRLDELTKSEKCASDTPKNKGNEKAKLHAAWQRLQVLCSRLYDSEMDKMPDNNKSPGIRQLIEKKHGLFRQNMMGKRVNFAARSVISPDPYICADEVGVPVIFATKLSYPQPVTPYNIVEMQKAVQNGPNVHPGAMSILFEDGITHRLKPDDPTQRLSLSDRISVSVHRNQQVPVVYRHLVNGDVMLLNRQPTLHKPSIMAHKVRVLPNEKTLRMHYANCKCYNADFDGDEMNAHFPQNELARAEAYEIATVNRQFLVPKDGSPLSGLIQDHIVAGTLLSVRGAFFNRDDFQELVYGALSFLNKNIVFARPAILKPEPLWTGKQIVSTLIKNIIPNGKAPPTVSIASKVKPQAFQSIRPRVYTAGGTPLQMEDMCESYVIIRQGELLCGIIDKASIGPTQFGLAHICYEIYGGETSTALLTAFARLSTNYLQTHSGLTLGIHDILVKDGANNKRRKAMKRSRNVGDLAVCESLGIEDADFSRETVVTKMREAHMHKNPIHMKQLDNSFKIQTDKINNDISGACLGNGLVKQFPANNLQLMIQAGAKGGTVNALQISCLLGQIELEGRRPPLMMSGKSLPSFIEYDTSPRAGGFIAGRFLTGIRPQEFFFHCMAGREGLIDTAVKTSRSGYLQRCIIKHLEGLVVNYDMTVRDSDGSVVQFLYGEDGLDILKSQLLNDKGIPTMIGNKKSLQPSKDEEARLQKSTDSESIAKHTRQITKWVKHNGTDRVRSKRGSAFLDFFQQGVDQANSENGDSSTVIHEWFNLSAIVKKRLNKYWLPCPDPVANVFQPSVHFGIVSEKLDKLLDNYVSKNPHSLIDPSSKLKKSNRHKILTDDFKKIVYARHIKSLCDPGEAVGLIAAQSIGEPSTQMTLNTFHFAGRGEMNVTLGIPRLNEILVTASANISTPSMDIPFRTDLQGDIEKQAENVRLKLNSVKLSDILESVDIKETLRLIDRSGWRVYELKFNFLPHKYYKRKFNVNAYKALTYFEKSFVKQLVGAVTRKRIALKNVNSLYDHEIKKREQKVKVVDEDGDEADLEANQEKRESKAFDDEDDVSSDDEGGEEDTTASKYKSRRDQDLGYEEEDDAVQIESDDEEKSNERDVTILEGEEPEEGSSGNAKSAKKSRKQQLLEDEKDERLQYVKTIDVAITDYDFDVVKQEWCSLKLQFELKSSKLDMACIIEEEARKACIHHVGRIDRAFLVKDNEASKRGASYDKMIKTEGVSFLDMVNFSDALDLNRMYSNDTHAIARTYGIEAAAKAIKREVTNVFAVYGIQVDPRHLSLISDYMTFNGSIKGMNRGSMSANSSPIQQMTFETTANFLKTAALMSFRDELESPSARIFAGRPSAGGTGLMSLVQNPKMMPPKPKRLKDHDTLKWSPNVKQAKDFKKRRPDAVGLRLNKRIKF